MFREYREEHCDDQGRQKSNITRQQAEGLKKLKKRCDEGEIVVCSTDKSGRLCVMPMEMYQELGRVHTAKDTEVDEKFVNDTQRRLNGHVSMWIKSLDMGADWKHHDRLRETQINHSKCVAPFYLLVKDHKSGPLSTRPVCGAVNGMDVHLSNILSPIIETVADEMKEKDEVISTDDALSRVNSFNDKQAHSTHCRDLFEPENAPGDTAEFVFSDVLDEILGEDWESEPVVREAEYSTDEEEFTKGEQEVDELHEARERQTEEIIVAGSDIISLFPSITVEQAEKLCYEALLETDISFEGVNYEEMAIYIALNYSSPSQIPANLRSIIPVRTKARGQRPGITSAAALSGKPTMSSGQWRFPRSQFTTEEKRMLLARAVAVGVKAVFRNHLYQFAGKTYRQSNGAPIGVRLSCAVARLIMNTWDRKLKTILAENKVKFETVFRYLDDWRGIMRALAAGWRWDNDKLRFRSAWREEDSKISPVERTCRELKKIMNTIFSNLQVEMEHAEMFEDKTLPTLNFRLFVQDNLVLYSFFQKPVANKCVIHKQSALGENSKIASHTQNLIRRMKCTSERLPMDSRVIVINDFCRQLISSG